MLPEPLKSFSPVKISALVRTSSLVGPGNSPPSPEQISVPPVSVVGGPSLPLMPGSEKTPVPSALPIRPLWQVEREAIEYALQHCAHDVPKAATLLEISPSTIYRKIQQWKTGASKSR
jgi:transcriptional regulator with GAF, ATPase, and Fis domain